MIAGKALFAAWTLVAFDPSTGFHFATTTVDYPNLESCQADATTYTNQGFTAYCLKRVGQDENGR